MFEILEHVLYHLTQYKDTKISLLVKNNCFFFFFFILFHFQIPIIVQCDRQNIEVINKK